MSDNSPAKCQMSKDLGLAKISDQLLLWVPDKGSMRTDWVCQCDFSKFRAAHDASLYEIGIIIETSILPTKRTLLGFSHNSALLW